ncbi:hypothetical protein NQZ79_g6087 [Umbelopsis isabellina]|nr:hypothetical protein NQZ79_g6087 [Umbelopsis isabellina]
MSTTTKLRFKSDRTLINSKFDGYKLQVFPENTNVHRFQLPTALSIPKVAMNSRLSYRELQARVKFNHLSISHQQRLAFYVDNESSVIGVELSQTGDRVRYHKIAQLQAPLTDVPSYAEPDSSTPLLPQYPSLHSLSSDMILASNGAGLIYAIKLNRDDASGDITGKILATSQFAGDGTEGLSPVPCVISDARMVDGEINIITWSVASQENDVPAHPTLDAPTSKTLFNIAYSKLLVSTSEENVAADLSIQHILRGRDIPFYCEFDVEATGYVMGSAHAYDVVFSKEDTEMKETSVETADEKKTSTSPYRWVQSSDDLTIVFQLPPNTPKSAISCKFNVQHMSLMVQNDQVTICSYPFRKLWDTIDPNSSVWTLDVASGLLTIELMKKNENVRWLHVFEQDDQVLEDLNPEQLKEIQERLEKFTGEGKAIGTPGWKQPLQHPIVTDMDEDIDHEGQAISLAWIDGDSGKIKAEVLAGGQEWISTSFKQPSSDKFSSVCLKLDVDGLVYAVERGDPISVKHTASFNALAFVQASKRDQRFIYHDPANAFSVILEGTRNAYIYYRHDDGKRNIDVQTLVDLTQGHDVDVIGTQLIDDKVILVLLETSVVVIDLQY